MDRPAALDEDMQVASADTPPQVPPVADDQGPVATLMAAAAAVPFDQLFPDAFAPGSTDAAAAMTAATAAGRATAPGVPIPAQKSYDMMVATGELPRGARPQNALGAIASIEAPIPAPRLPRTGEQVADAIISAYAPTGAGTPAERQLQALIENETTGAVGMARAGGTALTNSVGSPIGADALRSYAAQRRGEPRQALASIPALQSFSARETRFVAPGFDANLVQPAAMSSGAFAVLIEPAATDLSPRTELGAMVSHLGFHGHTPASLSLTRFTPAGSLLVASR